MHWFVRLEQWILSPNEYCHGRLLSDDKPFRNLSAYFLFSFNLSSCIIGEYFMV